MISGCARAGRWRPRVPRASGGDSEQLGRDRTEGGRALEVLIADPVHHGGGDALSTRTISPAAQARCNLTHRIIIECEGT